MKTEICQFEEINYIIRFPKEYKEGEKYPIILFLHGAGSRGTNIDILLSNPYFTITEEHIDFPFITIAPQCSKNTWFDLFETLQNLVRFIANKPYTDKSRIYVMGASMGGYATWQLAMGMPEYFAAICPICGGGMYWNANRLLNVPIWAFHGALDTTVRLEESQKMVDAVNHSGGTVKFTIFPKNGHDAWSDTYKNPAVFEWLLSNKNNNVTALSDKYSGSKLYG